MKWYFAPERRWWMVAPLVILVDLTASSCALAGGVPLRTAAGVGFLFAAVASAWSNERSQATVADRFSNTTKFAWLVVATLLIFCLRSGVMELLLHVCKMPEYGALVLATIVSALVMQQGYRLNAPGRWRAAAVSLVVYAFLLRLVYAAQVELLPEETYYWNYSRHLDIGYLDHPPLVAWLIRMGTYLFGSTEFGVRFGALGCALVTAFFVYRLTRNMFGEIRALLALLLVQLLPFFFLTGMLMTPDAPLTACWAATLYFLERALVAGHARAWLWAGIAMGCGMLSKYTIGLLGVVAVVFMLVDRPSRRWFLRWEPYMGVAIAAAIFSPVVLWNVQHDWASFAFQTSRRLAERPRFSVHKLIGAAMILITPTGLVAVAAALARNTPRSAAVGDSNAAAAGARAWLLLRIAVLVPLSVFFLFSLRHEVKLDWTGAPWIAALPLLVFASPRLRSAWPPTLLAVLSLLGVGLYYLALGIPGAGYPRQTELVPVGWCELGSQINHLADKLRDRYGERLLVVGMDRYAIASELAFYSDDQLNSVANTTTGHLFGGIGLMYEQWFPATQQAGRPLLLVAWDRNALELHSQLGGAGPIQEGLLLRNGIFVRRYYYRVADHYVLSASK